MLELHFPDFIKFNQRRYANGKPRLRWEEYQRAKAHHEIRRRPNQMWSVWGECWKTLEGGTLTDDPALAKDRSVNVIADKLLAPVCDIPLVEGATSPTKLSDRPYGSTLSLKDKVFDPKKNCWVYQYTQEPVWESDGRTLNEKSLENIERIGTLFSSPMSEGSLVDKNKKFPVGGDYVTVERRSSVGPRYRAEDRADWRGLDARAKNRPPRKKSRLAAKACQTPFDYSQDRPQRAA